MIDIATLRLWQLISPALPVGAYAYSQGLEYAITEAWVHDETSALTWISGISQHSIVTLDLPVMQRMHHAWQRNDEAQLLYWSRFLAASRESSEILAEDNHLGKSLARLLGDLEVEQAVPWSFKQEVNFPLMFSLAAAHWEIEIQQALAGYLWAWCENQVAVAIKTIPLGQTAGQRVLSALIKQVPTWIDQSSGIEDDAIGVLCPGLAIASAHHETQYSRLFRS